MPLRRKGRQVANTNEGILSAIADEGGQADEHDAEATRHRRNLDKLYLGGHKRGLSVTEMAKARGRDPQTIRLRLKAMGVVEDLRPGRSWPSIPAGTPVKKARKPAAAKAR